MESATHGVTKQALHARGNCTETGTASLVVSQERRSAHEGVNRGETKKAEKKEGRQKKAHTCLHAPLIMVSPCVFNLTLAICALLLGNPDIPSLM